jgi:methyl-accepting chemotaxis protein
MSTFLQFVQASIARKIIMGFVIVLSVFFLGFIGIGYNLLQMSKVKDRVVTLRFPIVELASNLHRNITTTVSETRGYILYKADEVDKNRRQIWQQDIQPALVILDSMSKGFTNPANKVRVVNAQKWLPELQRLQDQAILLAATSNEQALALLSSQHKPLASKVLKEIDDLLVNQRELVHIDNDLLADGVLTVWITLAIALILSVLSGIWIARRLATSIVQPVEQLKQAAQQVEQGNLSVELSLATTDETASLASAFNHMIAGLRAEEQARAYVRNCVAEILQAMERFASGDLTIVMPDRGNDEMGRLFSGFNQALQNIRTIIAEIQSSAEWLSDASGQISSATEQLAAASQEQAAQAGQISAAVEEMSATTHSNSNTARLTSEQAGESRSVAIQGNQVVGETVRSISSLSGLMEKSTQSVMKLNESSARISEIVSVITDITDRTNLLALNASIEAARAGEQGRGFAVVAEEVRKLAERTSSSTTEIRGIIKAIQEEVSVAANMMQSSMGEFHKGITVAGSAGQALEQIVAVSESVSEKINSIAAASHEQSATTEQIAKSIESMSHVIADSARSVNDIAGSSVRLYETAMQLREKTSIFRLEDNEQYNAPLPTNSHRRIHRLPA